MLTSASSLYLASKFKLPRRVLFLVLGMLLLSSDASADEPYFETEPLQQYLYLTSCPQGTFPLPIKKLGLTVCVGFVPPEWWNKNQNIWELKLCNEPPEGGTAICIRVKLRCRDGKCVFIVTVLDQSFECRATGPDELGVMTIVCDFPGWVPVEIDKIRYKIDPPRHEVCVEVEYSDHKKSFCFDYTVFPDWERVIPQTPGYPNWTAPKDQE